MHRRRKQKKAAQKKCRSIAQAYRGGVRKAKAQVEVNLERVFKTIKKKLL